jgi:hypothetical protein
MMILPGAAMVILALTVEGVDAVTLAILLPLGTMSFVLGLWVAMWRQEVVLDKERGEVRVAVRKIVWTRRAYRVEELPVVQIRALKVGAAGWRYRVFLVGARGKVFVGDSGDRAESERLASTVASYLGIENQAAGN